MLIYREHREKEYGKQLMTYFCEQFPSKEVYVSGANDAHSYYAQLGFVPEGIVYRVKA